MPPGHIAPVDAFRIMLEKEVICAFIIHQSIGIIQPVLFRREMKLRTIGFMVFCLCHGSLSFLLFKGFVFLLRPCLSLLKYRRKFSLQFDQFLLLLIAEMS